MSITIGIFKEDILGRKKASITIKDIADQLGVSFSTVAKALKDDPVVAERTRLLVQEKATEMGYIPNLMASGLRSKSTRSIGIVLNDLENPTRSHIIKKITLGMADHGLTAFIFDSSYDASLEQKNIISLLSRNPEAIIISPVEAKLKNIRLLENVYANTIILSRPVEGIPANYVHMDHRQGGYISASAMLARGHKKNLIIMEPLSYPSGAQFLEGVTRAYKEYGAQLSPENLVYCLPSLEITIRVILNLYNQENRSFKVPFTGVIASSDIAAAGVYQAAREIGIKIPEEISVIGYDDLPLARLLEPPLTTLSYPMEEIASLCVDLLVTKVVNQENGLKNISLKPKLVARDSVRDIN